MRRRGLGLFGEEKEGLEAVRRWCLGRVKSIDRLGNQGNRGTSRWSLFEVGSRGFDNGVPVLRSGRPV